MHYSTNLLRHLRCVIGQNIFAMRTKQSVSLKELSMRSGVSELHIDRYEQGKSNIQLEELMRLACALNLPVTALLSQE